MQSKLAEMGIRRIGQLQSLDGKALGRFGKWGSALAAKARGEDGGGWFDHEVGARELPKSISHETTFGEDTADTALIDATLAKLVQLVARRLREHGLWSRTIQIKLRYTDFTTLTRAKTLDEATQLDNVILETVRKLFRENWSGRKVRLLGVQAGSLTDLAGQLGLLDEDARKKWGGLLAAADKLRDRFGESAVGLAGAMKHGRRERVHENPAGLPGKTKDEG
jgi:DNA polymerase-4